MNLLYYYTIMGMIIIKNLLFHTYVVLSYYHTTYNIESTKVARVPLHGSMIRYLKADILA
jgi:hypothetical protein